MAHEILNLVAARVKLREAVLESILIETRNVDRDTLGNLGYTQIADAARELVAAEDAWLEYKKILDAQRLGGMAE